MVGLEGFTGGTVGPLTTIVISFIYEKSPFFILGVGIVSHGGLSRRFFKADSGVKKGRSNLPS